MYSITINPESLNFSHEGGTREIAISANFNYEIMEDADWLTYRKSNNGITITVSKNTTTTARSAEIVLSKNSYAIKSIVVTQESIIDQNSWSESGSVAGEWELIAWGGSLEAKPTIYLALYEDGSFDLYQYAWTAMWAHFSGTYTYKDNILTGVYSDSTNWADSYKVTFSTSSKQMCFTSLTDNANSSIYEATTIPQDVIEGSASTYSTRSVASKPWL
jgi:hypothetical protein